MKNHTITPLATPPARRGRFTASLWQTAAHSMLTSHLQATFPQFVAIGRVGFLMRPNGFTCYRSKSQITALSSNAANHAAHGQEGGAR